MAYLLNRREFYGRDFALESSVLIPRPETETLVEAALARMTPRARFLDLGTGSGAVAVTLACQRPESTGVATDVSEAALRVARGNAGRHLCAERIEFLRGSWYEPVGPGAFDVIVWTTNIQPMLLAKPDSDRRMKYPVQPADCRIQNARFLSSKNGWSRPMPSAIGAAGD